MDNPILKPYYDENYQDGISQGRLLSEGMFVNTEWGWEAIIEKIDVDGYKFGQGLNVIRIGDNKRFNIHPKNLHLTT